MSQIGQDLIAKILTAVLKEGATTEVRVLVNSALSSINGSMQNHSQVITVNLSIAANSDNSKNNLVAEQLLHISFCLPEFNHELLAINSFEDAPYGSVIVLKEEVAGLTKSETDITLNGKANNNTFGLTFREKEVLQWMKQGYMHKEIAAKMFISKNTLRNHISSIYRKLVVKNKIEAINKFAG